MSTRVVIPGAAGRMGRMLVRAIHEAKDLSLAAAVEHAGHVQLGADAGTVAGVGLLDRELGADLDGALATGDVAIDFTAPQATIKHLDQYVAAGKPLVIGTTGFTAEQRALIERAANGRRKVRLQVSMPGYETKELEVEVTANENKEVPVTLAPKG